MSKKVKIKKGDQVLVLAGADRDARGKVLRVFPTKGTAIVERVNMIKRHTRPNPQKGIQGGVLEREAPIHLSNLMLIDPETGNPTRVKLIRQEDGQGARVAKRDGTVLD